MSQDLPSLPLHPSETAEEDEEALIAEAIEWMRRVVSREAHGGVSRRGAHAKANAFVEAELVVPHQPEQPLAQGLFACPGSYRAWVRFSNASEASQSDRKPDGRGLALKILDVPGEKFLVDGAGEGVQDLVFTTIPTLPFRTIAEAVDFTRRTAQGLQPLYFASMEGIRRALQVAPHVHADRSLLDLPWNTVAASQLGEHEVKYHLRLRTGLVDPQPRGPDRLRAQLRAQLLAGPVIFELCAQARLDPELHPVEDIGVVWRPEDSPLVPLATLRFAQQDIADPERDVWGDRLRFNPWHARLDMRPLGRLNRARRVIYATLAAERHAANQTRPAEPNGPS